MSRLEEQDGMVFSEVTSKRERIKYWFKDLIEKLRGYFNE